LRCQQPAGADCRRTDLALDARLRNQILELLVEQCEAAADGDAVISHDCRWWRSIATALVMYQGEKVDEMAAQSAAAGHASLHAHALDLPPDATPRPDAADARPNAAWKEATMALVEVNQLQVTFGKKRRFPPPVLPSRKAKPSA
jgi:ABC-type dipeptide/oligopeptide/nickel transport system ATPase component